MILKRAEIEKRIPQGSVLRLDTLEVDEDGKFARGFLRVTKDQCFGNSEKPLKWIPTEMLVQTFVIAYHERYDPNVSISLFTIDPIDRSPMELGELVVAETTLTKIEPNFLVARGLVVVGNRTITEADEMIFELNKSNGK